MVQQQPPNFGFVDSIEPSLDVAYPTTYYPDTTDPARAEPIIIRGGDPVDLSVQLQPVPALTLTLPRTTAANGQPQSSPMLRTTIFGQNVPPMDGMTANTPTEVIFTGLVPGDYILSNLSSNPANSPAGRRPLHRSERVTSATLRDTSDFAHGHLLLKTAHRSPILPNTWVGLVRSHITNSAVSNIVDDNGIVDLDASHGEYYFSVQVNQSIYFVRQILRGDQILPSNNIHLTAGDATSFTLTIIPGIHTIKGVAWKDGKPFAGGLHPPVPPPMRPATFAHSSVNKVTTMAALTSMGSGPELILCSP